MLRELIKYFFVFYFFQISCNNLLVKAFYHLGICDDKLVFYFKKTPLLNLISKKSNDKFQETTFLMPGIKLDDNDELKAIFQKINNFKHSFYNLKLLETLEGIEIKFISDPKVVYKIDAYEFSAISSFKGLVFDITHKKIKENNDVNLLKFKPNVVIDIGHGGNDSGAKGCCNIFEKEVTYLIGKKLQKLLERKGFNVFLTRDSDTFVSLDERTTFANFLPASIFVSIHANFSVNSKACGIETHYSDYSLLNKFDFDKNILLKQKCTLQDENNKFFANVLHDELFKNIKQINSEVIDRKVKKSVSQVLLGTEMASVLLEVGFLSNKDECVLLMNSKYQQALANGIFNGICKYLDYLA